MSNNDSHPNSDRIRKKKVRVFDDGYQDYVCACESILIVAYI